LIATRTRRERRSRRKEVDGAVGPEWGYFRRSARVGARWDRRFRSGGPKKYERSRWHDGIRTLGRRVFALASPRGLVTGRTRSATTHPAAGRTPAGRRHLGAAGEEPQKEEQAVQRKNRRRKRAAVDFADATEALVTRRARAARRSRRPPGCVTTTTRPYRSNVVVTAARSESSDHRAGYAAP
jgi:hypothetical protein